MEYEYEIYMHSHLVLNTVLGKWSEMEKWNGAMTAKITNNIKTTNHWQF